MRRVLAIFACGIALAACTSSGSDMFKSAPQTMTLQFESEPQGADVKTSGGQTCRTPCALAVPGADMTATFNLKGYQPQTVPVKLLPPENPREDPNSKFMPNPVYAELEIAGPPPKKPAPAKKKQAAKKPAFPAGAPSDASAPPPAASPWPPAANPVR